jgi:hypothetical protein
MKPILDCPMARGFRLNMVNSIFPNETTNRNPGSILLSIDILTAYGTEPSIDF